MIGAIPTILIASSIVLIVVDKGLGRWKASIPLTYSLAAGLGMLALSALLAILVGNSVIVMATLFTPPMLVGAWVLGTARKSV